MWLTFPRLFCSVLIRDPAGHFRGMRSVTVIWPYLRHLGSVLDRASGGAATPFDGMLGTHEPMNIAAHIVELVIGLQMIPVSRFDIL